MTGETKIINTNYIQKLLVVVVEVADPITALLLAFILMGIQFLTVKSRRI